MKKRNFAHTLTALSALLVAGTAWPLQAICGPHDRVSSDGIYEATELSLQDWINRKLTKKSESFSGAGEITDETLSTEGVEIYDGLGGKFTDQEFEELLGLPVPTGSTATEAGAEVILGPDTRQQLYTTNYPARAVVLVTFSGGRCSGAMIGRDTVATAGHCVHSGGTSGSWRTNVRVYPGANGSSKPFGYCTARRLHSVTGWTRDRNEDYDYGAIKLNCTVGNTVGWFGLTTANPLNLPSIVQGYPGDKPLTQWASSDKVHTTSSRQIFYSNDTTGGMSGSAVWYDRNGPYMIGIHAYGTHGSGSHSLYNHGARIVSPVFNNLISWRNAP